MAALADAPASYTSGDTDRFHGFPLAGGEKFTIGEVGTW